MLTTKLRNEIVVSISEVFTITTFIFLIFILFRTKTLQVNDNVFVNDLLSNWEGEGIKQIYIPKEGESCDKYNNTELFSRTWEGTDPACDCRSSYHYGVKSDIFLGQCSVVQIAVGCKDISPVTSSQANVWKGSKLCVEKHESNFFDTITVVGDKCPKKYLLCGTDTKNFNLCFPKKSGCPINKIKINNNHLSANEKKDNFYETIKLNEDWFLHHSNNFNNDSLIIDVKYSEGRVCINPSETNLKNYMKFKKNSKNLNSNDANDQSNQLMKDTTVTQIIQPPYLTCNTKIGKFNYDERYKSIDSVSKFKFYSDNNIMTKVEKLPQLNSQDLITYNSFLYQRSYIHWSPYCRDDRELSPEAIVKDLINLSIIDGYFDFIRFYLFFVFFFYIMLTFINSFFGFIPRKLNILLNNFSFILLLSFIPMIILLIFILNNNAFIIKKFVTQKCGDYVTNMSFNDIGKNLTELTISAFQIILAGIVLITILVVNKLIKG